MNVVLPSVPWTLQRLTPDRSAVADVGTEVRAKGVHDIRLPLLGPVQHDLAPEQREGLEFAWLNGPRPAHHVPPRRVCGVWPPLHRSSINLFPDQLVG
jgi:hypothetical protein